ncbi:MAG: 9-O-acetyl-N-acetylneuraminate esterase, partial [Lachnospiraceae bacterium]|nr:9-O-acetyl-N-acetylneuraminate esterase [Lachnospiraceae bacterium]
LYSILINGARIPWSPDQDDIAQMQMYGFIRNEKNTVRIDNRIFETRLYNLFLSDEEMRSNVFAKRGDLAKNQFVKDGMLESVK